MTRTITIDLTETEMKLLLKAAALDCRRPQEEARYLLRNTLFARAGQMVDMKQGNANGLMAEIEVQHG